MARRADSVRVFAEHGIEHVDGDDESSQSLGRDRRRTVDCTEASISGPALSFEQQKITADATDDVSVIFDHCFIASVDIRRIDVGFSVDELVAYVLGARPDVGAEHAEGDKISVKLSA